MPVIGAGRVISGITTFPPVPSGNGIQTFKLETVSQGTSLFERFTNIDNNVSLGLRTIYGGTGIVVNVNQGMIYISADVSLFPVGPTGPVGPMPDLNKASILAALGRLSTDETIALIGYTPARVAVDQPYILAFASSAVITSDQIIGFHKFPCDVTFAADFGISDALDSGGGCFVAPAADTTITIGICRANDDPTDEGNWISVGTATIPAGEHDALLSTNHARVLVLQNDFMRCRAPTEETTMADFFITLVGAR